MNPTINKFINELGKRDNIVGILLFGSRARGNNSEESDVDLLVLRNDTFEKKVEIFDELTFEIIFTTEKLATEYWEENKNDAYDFWSIAKTLLDKDGTVARIRNKMESMLKTGKKPLSKDEINNYKFDVEDKIRYVESIYNDDITKSSMIIFNMVYNLIEFYFDLNCLWTPAPKQRLEKIKELDPELYELIECFYHDEESIMGNIDYAKDLVEYIFDETKLNPQHS